MGLYIIVTACPKVKSKYWISLHPVKQIYEQENDYSVIDLPLTAQHWDEETLAQQCYQELLFYLCLESSSSASCIRATISETLTDAILEHLMI